MHPRRRPGLLAAGLTVCAVPVRRIIGKELDGDVGPCALSSEVQEHMLCVAPQVLVLHVRMGVSDHVIPVSNLCDTHVIPM